MGSAHPRGHPSWGPATCPKAVFFLNHETVGRQWNDQSGWRKIFTAARPKFGVQVPNQVTMGVSQSVNLTAQPHCSSWPYTYSYLTVCIRGVRLLETFQGERIIAMCSGHVQRWPWWQWAHCQSILKHGFSKSLNFHNWQQDTSVQLLCCQLQKGFSRYTPQKSIPSALIYFPWKIVCFIMQRLWFFQVPQC